MWGSMEEMNLAQKSPLEQSACTDHGAHIISKDAEAELAKLLRDKNQEKEQKKEV
jgi:hypothetical protein